MSKRSYRKQKENGKIEEWNRKGQIATKRLFEEGLHTFQDKAKQKERAIKRTQEGKNPFQGENGSLIAKDNNRRMLSEGCHPSQTRVSCIRCKKDYSIANYVRYHNGKCEV